MMPTAEKLSLRNSDFVKIRETGEIYVDKTAFVYELASTYGAYLLHRPRFFGKSLLLSTFDDLFAHGLRNFLGLAIDGRWKDKTYPVLRLDFSLTQDCQTKEDFFRLFA
ncbi:MAG: AAA family ATPase, partial [Sutterellaceae bacterium]|nr:AAA family ATPase [Sutterellaceae bacterium]